MTLKELRNKKNLTQAQLSKLTGIGQSRISELDNLTDWDPIQIGTVKKISNALEMPIKKFIEKITEGKTMTIYFAKTNASNLLLAVNEKNQTAKYWHGNSHGISPDGIDLYSGDVVKQYQEFFSQNIINDFDDLVGDFNNEIIKFNPDDYEFLEEVYSE